MSDKEEKAKDIPADNVGEEVTEALEEVTETIEGAKEEIQEVAETTEEAKKEVQEAEKAVEKAEEAVEEVKEAVFEPKEEEKPAEEKKGEPVKEKTEEVKTKPEKKPEPTGKFKDLIKTIESLSVIELADLVKTLEDRLGVSSAAPIAVAGTAPATGAATPAEEEKSAFNVVLTSAGNNKIAVIKAVREVLPDLGLKEAKDMVDSAPATVKENMKKEETETAKEKLTAAGATIELQ
jgi:large subunit ribosomal protein L7/L12